MMGRRQVIKSGDEHDVVTGWRRMVCWCKRAGATKRVKQMMNRRERREANEKLKEVYRKGREMRGEP